MELGKQLLAHLVSDPSSLVLWFYGDFGGNFQHLYFPLPVISQLAHIHRASLDSNLSVVLAPCDKRHMCLKLMLVLIFALP